jgi:hypothetical protein
MHMLYFFGGPVFTKEDVPILLALLAGTVLLCLAWVVLLVLTIRAFIVDRHTAQKRVWPYTMLPLLVLIPLFLLFFA